MTAKIAVITVSDRAAAGIYEDKGGPAIEAWLRRAITSPLDIRREIVTDGREVVADAFRRWGLAYDAPRGEPKGHLVFAPAKYMSNRQLKDHGIDFAPLPFALYREA